MTYSAQEQAYLWLCACTKTDLRERTVLLNTADPLTLFERADEIIPSTLKKGKGKFEERYHVRKEELEKFLAYLEKRGYFAVTPLSDDYPEEFQHITLPPLVLYGAGNRELLKKRKFCIVGSRVTPAWAGKIGRDIAAELSQKFAIVTGLAEGGDAAVIAGALPSGNLISVLPCGLDECYPAAHSALKERIAKEGLLLTELSPKEQARKHSFHARNRILAGLSEGVLVLSAAKKSGALITANYSLEYSRDVYALPYNVGSSCGEGCNDLIKKGAFLVTEAEDILPELGLRRSEKEKASFTEEESRVLAVLKELGEAHLAQLAARTGMRIFEATAVLSALEIKGVAVKSGGNKFSAV